MPHSSALWMATIKAQYPALRVVGEVFDGDPAMLRFFEGAHRTHDGITTGVDYHFDFPLFYPVRDAFGQRKSIRPLAQMLMRDHLYADPMRLMPFLGLHDVSRFMHEPGATADGLKLAFTTVLTMRGTPLLYYGDEIALAGGNDPDNRRDFPGGWPSDARSAFEPAGRTATVTLPAPVMGRDVLGACGVPSGRALTIPARRSCVFVPGY